MYKVFLNLKYKVVLAFEPVDKILQKSFKKILNKKS